MESMKPSQLADPLFCLVIQYDAAIGPVILFNNTKHLIMEQKIKCCVLCLVQINKKTGHLNWVYLFEDGWDYCFVNEVVIPANKHNISLKELVQSNKPVSEFIL